jgi:beta-glucosidase
VASGDLTTTRRATPTLRPAAADDDDLAARLADPVLAASRADVPAPTDPPDVWGRLAAPAAEDARAQRGAADDDAVEERARELLDRLSLHEKLGLLSGDGTLVRGLTALARDREREPYVAGELPRLGLPGIRAVAGPRGVAVGAATAFPVPMARAASFDPGLERRVGDAIGAECRAIGGNLLLGVSANLVRHPAWGRAQDTYGEDPHLVGEMAAAAVEGVQGHVMACVAHLGGASTEAGRYTAAVTAQDDDLRALDLPPFRRCVDAGAAAVMTAAHRLDGTHCGHHEQLLTGVLKGDWSFDGFVAGDLVLGVRSGRAVAAGTDLELPFHWRFRSLERLVRRRRVTPERVDDAALRLLRQQVRAAARASGADARRYAPAGVAGEAHRALAREAAERSMVLLRNHPVRAGGPGRPAEPVLPLDPEQVSSVVVLGDAAAHALTGAPGSSQVRPPAIATLLDGLRAAGERWVIDVPHVRGDDLDAAGLAAAAADVAVVVAGPAPRDEGEDPPLPWPRRRGGDRRSLTLGDADEALIRTVAAANPRTVVVLVGGSAIVTEGWREQVAAVLVAWYPGMEGGHALARVLFGEVSPGGRLPATWPRAAEQLPRVAPRARSVRLGPLHGYRLMEATGRSPAFPFGFGLSYTTFEHGRLTAKRTLEGTVRLTVPVVNTGTVPGDEVVQVYVDEALGSDPRPLRTLRAFRRVTVAPGTVANVVFELGPDVVAMATSGGTARLYVGRDADPDGHRSVEA